LGAFKQTTEMFHKILLNALPSKTFSLFSTSQKQPALTVQFLGDLDWQTFSSREKRVYGE